MKLILRIFIIFLVAAFVAGALWLIVNNTSLAAGLESPGEGSHQGPGMLQAGENFQRPEGLEGGGPFQGGRGGERGDEQASLARALPDLLGLLLKVALITVGVLILEKITSLLRRRKAGPVEA